MCGPSIRPRLKRRAAPASQPERVIINFRGKHDEWGSHFFALVPLPVRAACSALRRLPDWRLQSNALKFEAVKRWEEPACGHYAGHGEWRFVAARCRSWPFVAVRGSSWHGSWQTGKGCANTRSPLSSARRSPRNSITLIMKLV